jgi:hypothetical protein
MLERSEGADDPAGTFAEETDEARSETDVELPDPVAGSWTAVAPPACFSIHGDGDEKQNRNEPGSRCE